MLAKAVANSEIDLKTGQLEWNMVLETSQPLTEL